VAVFKRRKFPTRDFFPGKICNSQSFYFHTNMKNHIWGFFSTSTLQFSFISFRNMGNNPINLTSKAGRICYAGNRDRGEKPNSASHFQ